MALLLAIACILGNKHEANKTLIEKIGVLAVLIAVLGYSIVPQTTLAFEVELKNAPARKLVAPVKLLHSEDFQDEAVVVYEPEYSKRMVNLVVARGDVVTKPGDWNPTKLAQTKKDNRVRPAIDNPVILEGEASYYSRAGCLGCNPLRIMANGQPLNDQALTMAIGANLKHLVGYRAKVTNINTGQSVDVLITDTGGFYKEKYGSRVADLTIASKQAIGMHGGVGQVRVEVH
jgi:rare lipoprotein A (peptidoglycan hydrolase)